MQLQKLSLALGGVALFLVSGCSGDSEASDPSGQATDIRIGSVPARLSRAQDCEDLLSRIQSDAEAKIRAQADLLLQDYGQFAQGGGMGGMVMPATSTPGTTRGPGVDTAMDDGAVGAPPLASAPSPAPGETNAGGVSVGGSTSAWDGAETTDNAQVAGPSEFSETNQQVSGVDEADIVKTDGTNIYLLHGTSLYVVKSWPAEDLAVDQQVVIDGSPQEMFVSNGTALVYSAVGDPMPGDPGAVMPVNDYYVDDSYYGGSFTKLTVVDVSGSQPEVVAERYIEGQYRSSRMHGTFTRGVIQGGFKAPRLYAPEVEFYDPWGEPYDEAYIEAQLDSWVERVSAAIQATELSDWLPREYAGSADALEAVTPQCAGYYVPQPGAVNYGQTSIVALDLAEPTVAQEGVVVLGEASTVYANEGALVLAQPDYWWDFGQTSGDRTALHSFELDGPETSYLGSGHAPGMIDDQFALDEKDGVVRVTTTQWNPQSGDRFSQVLTLHEVDGALEVLGKSPELAPGETVMATRYVGDIAYVVTFLQRDPLFAIDLSEPAKPKLLGQLKIDGFSEYMHPLGEGYLLTIGRDVDPESGNDLGLMLQVFDVREPTAPALVHSYAYTEGGWSAASAEHKAFTFFPERDLLAFPYVNYTTGSSASSLEVFRVTVDDGFEPLGSIEHTPLIAQGCPDFQAYAYGCGYSPEVRRGLFIEDFVFSISYGGILAHDLSELATPVASLALPQPDMYYGDVYYTEPGMVEPGVVNVPVPVTQPDGTMPVPVPAAGGAGGASAAPSEPATGATTGTTTSSDTAPQGATPEDPAVVSSGSAGSSASVGSGGAAGS